MVWRIKRLGSSEQRSSACWLVVMEGDDGCAVAKAGHVAGSAAAGAWVESARSAGDVAGAALILNLLEVRLRIMGRPRGRLFGGRKMELG